MRKRITLCFLLILGLGGTSPAWAWNQGFYEAGQTTSSSSDPLDNFDHFQIWIESPGAFELPTGISFSGGSSWSQSYNDGQFLTADGPTSSFERLRLYFASAPNESFTAYFQSYSGQTLLQNQTLVWGGNGRNGGWTITNGTPKPAQRFDGAPVPEPSGMALFVLGFVVLGFMMIRRSRIEHGSLP